MGRGEWGGVHIQPQTSTPFSIQRRLGLLPRALCISDAWISTNWLRSGLLSALRNAVVVHSLLILPSQAMALNVRSSPGKKRTSERAVSCLVLDMRKPYAGKLDSSTTIQGDWIATFVCWIALFWNPAFSPTTAPAKQPRVARQIAATRQQAWRWTLLLAGHPGLSCPLLCVFRRVVSSGSWFAE